MDSTSTDLAIIGGTANLPALFGTEDGIGATIARIEAEARSHTADVNSAKGRKEIASLAHKVARSKTALDDAGKSLTDGMRKQIDAVDAERRLVRTRLDALKAEVRKPLTDWEAAEDARVERIKAQLATFDTGSVSPMDHSAIIEAQIAAVEAIPLTADLWAEYLPAAGVDKDRFLIHARHCLASAVKREAEAAELARLRAEQEEREAAERAALEAEAAAVAAAEAEKAEAERAARFEREKAEAAAAAELAAEARHNAEVMRREAEHARQIAAAKAEAERAAQAERDRIARDALEADAARARRAADEAHRTCIRDEIAAAMKSLALKNYTDAADALIAGKVPHVKVML